MRATAYLATATFVFAATMACGKSPGAYHAAAKGAADAANLQPMLEEADALFEQRVQADKLQASLDLYQQVVDKDPRNRLALLRLTRGYYFMADTLTSDKKDKVELWGKSIEFGKQCIALNDDIAQQMAEGAKEKDAIDSATLADVPCIYWTASSLGKWGKTQGLAKTIAHLPTVKAYMTTVEGLDPEFYHFGPSRYWGAYYGLLPSFAGQDLDKSADYFARSLDGAPGYLATRGLRAEILAVKNQDLGLFLEDINFILSADPTTIPEITPENQMEQEKARALLLKKDELFDKKVLKAFEDGQADQD